MASLNRAATFWATSRCSGSACPSISKVQSTSLFDVHSLRAREPKTTMLASVEDNPLTALSSFWLVLNALALAWRIAGHSSPTTDCRRFIGSIGVEGFIRRPFSHFWLTACELLESAADSQSISRRAISGEQKANIYDGGVEVNRGGPTRFHIPVLMRVVMVDSGTNRPAAKRISIAATPSSDCKKSLGAAA